jgi:Ca2+-binding RTX toxin-like protein
VGSNGRRPAAQRGPLQRGRWLFVGVFVLAAVLSANGRVPGISSDPSPAVESGATFRGERTLGTRGHDVIRGSTADDIVFTFGGDDRAYGGDGSDLIDPGNGEDVVSAGPADDRIRAYDLSRDVIRCGPGSDVAYVDDLDVPFDCEELLASEDLSAPATPDPPAMSEVADEGVRPAPLVRGTISLVDEPWSCDGPVDVELVKVRISDKAHGVDAVSLGHNCTGRIGRIEVDTWSGDGIKVQSAAPVAHDLVVDSGVVRCYGASDGYHQDGIQVMGGKRLTFRNTTVLCGGPSVNAQLFIAHGGTGGSPPSEILFENGVLGPNAAHTILLADSERSGVRETLICAGRHNDIRVDSTAGDPVVSHNRVRGDDHPSCRTQ